MQPVSNSLHYVSYDDHYEYDHDDDHDDAMMMIMKKIIMINSL